MTAPLRVALVVNDAAGSGRAVGIAARAHDLLRRVAEVDLVREATPAAARESLRTAVVGGIDAVVAVGGDGTVHHVLQEVAGSGVPLGIVPGGSGDDIAAAAGLPRSADRAIAAVLIGLDDLRAGRPGPELDLGRARPLDPNSGEPTWFGATLYAGFDARVNARADAMTSVRGRLRYPAAMLAELATFAPFDATLLVDAGPPEQLQACVVVIANGSSYGGGMQVVPHADPRDGLLDAMVLAPVPRVELLRVFPRVYRGTHGSHPAVSFRQGRWITLDAAGQQVRADGEPVGTGPISVEPVPGALRLLAPGPDA